MRRTVSEVIVVEGKNDVNKVLSCIQGDVLATSGTHMSAGFLEYLKQLAQQRTIVVMTDDDYPGRWIRSKIEATIGPVQHAYVFASESRQQHKVGIEHASCQAIIEALDSVVRYEIQQDSLSYQDFYELKLQGFPDSQQRRTNLCQKMRLPKMNAKRLFKSLNQLGYKKEEVLKYVNHCE